MDTLRGPPGGKKGGSLFLDRGAHEWTCCTEPRRMVTRAKVRLHAYRVGHGQPSSSRDNLGWRRQPALSRRCMHVPCRMGSRRATARRKNFFKLSQSICETVPSALLGLPVGRPVKENSPALHHLTTPMFGDPRESTRVRGVVSRGLPPGSSGEEKIACMHVPSLHGRSDPNSKLSSCGTASAEARRDR